MKNTSFKVEIIFGDVISKNDFSQEQITKLNNLFERKRCEYKHKNQF